MKDSLIVLDKICFRNSVFSTKTNFRFKISAKIDHLDKKWPFWRKMIIWTKNEQLDQKRSFGPKSPKMTIRTKHGHLGKKRTIWIKNAHFGPQLHIWTEIDHFQIKNYHSQIWIRGNSEFSNKKVDFDGILGFGFFPE